MKFTCVVLGLAISSTSSALCPYAKRALEDAEPTKQQHKQRQSGAGNTPFTTFNENQLIDVTGEYAWVAPGPDDLRGPCPGLNALANHGYFPHSGVVPLAVGESATEQVYGRCQDPRSWCLIVTLSRSWCRSWDPINGVCYTYRWGRCVSDAIVWICEYLNANTTLVRIHGVLEENSRRL